MVARNLAICSFSVRAASCTYFCISLVLARSSSLLKALMAGYASFTFSTRGWMSFMSRVDLSPNSDFRILLKFIAYIILFIILIIMCKGTNIFVQLCTICRILITRSDVCNHFCAILQGLKRLHLHIYRCRHPQRHLGNGYKKQGENKACNLCRRHGIAADRGCRKNVRTRVLTYRHWEPGCV